MNKFVFVVAICYITVVRSSYHSSHDIQLQSVPNINSYAKTVYPKPGLQDLGEHSEQDHTPKVIKIIKTVKIEVPKPYPVHVSHKVPYPVAVKIPHIIKVPHVVKINQPVPVEVVKHVPAHQESNEGQSEGGYGGYGGSYGGSFGDHGQGQASALTSGGDYGGHDSGVQQIASIGYELQGDHGNVQSSYRTPDSYSAQGGSYGGAGGSYGGAGGSYGGAGGSLGAQTFGDHSGFVPSYPISQGDGHSSDASNSVSSYQSYGSQYSGGDQGGDQQEDHSAQATSGSGAENQQVHGAVTVQAGYQVKDAEDGGMSHQ